MPIGEIMKVDRHGGDVQWGVARRTLEQNLASASGRRAIVGDPRFRVNCGLADAQPIVSCSESAP